MRLWTSTVNVRPVQPDEYDDLIRLLCLGFRLDYQMASHLFYQDPQLDLSERWGLWLEEGGQPRLVSVLTLIPAPMWVGEVVVSCGGIAGVTTHPDLRERGYASKLLIEVLKYLPTQGYQAAALLPFQYEFYRRLGWEMVGTLLRLRQPVSRLPRYPELSRVRRFEMDDLPDLQRLHNAFSHHRTGAILRGEQRWYYLLWNNRHKWVWVQDGRVEGYLFYDLIEDGNVLRVREFVWESERARRGLLGLLAQNREGVHHVDFHGTIRDLQRLQPGYAQREHRQPEEPLARLEVMPGFMWRAVHARNLLETLVLPLGAIPVPLTLHLHDRHCSWNETPLSLVPHGEQTEIREGSEARPPVRMDIRTFSMLTIGAVDVHDALARHWLHAPQEVIPALEFLFPYREPCLIPNDYF